MDSGGSTEGSTAEDSNTLNAIGRALLQVSVWWGEGWGPLVQLGVVESTLSSLLAYLHSVVPPNIVVLRQGWLSTCPCTILLHDYQSKGNALLNKCTEHCHTK